MEIWKTIHRILSLNGNTLKADPTAVNKLFNELFFLRDFKIVDFNYFIRDLYVYMDTCKL